MDHFTAPRNAGRLLAADAVGQADVAGSAPRITIYLQVAGERIEHVTFQSFGCGASIAAGSALTELVQGKTVQECRLLVPGDVESALGGLPPQKRFCATLAIVALNNALDQLVKGNDE